MARTFEVSGTCRVSPFFERGMVTTPALRSTSFHRSPRNSLLRSPLAIRQWPGPSSAGPLPGRRDIGLVPWLSEHSDPSDRVSLGLAVPNGDVEDSPEEGKLPLDGRGPDLFKALGAYALQFGRRDFFEGAPREVILPSLAVSVVILP